MASNKIVLLFPDGVGIRNYLYSNVFNNTQSKLILFHSFDSITENEILENNNIDEAILIPKYKESTKEKFLRELICFARLKHNSKLVNNLTIRTNWIKKHKGFYKKTFYKVIEATSIFVYNYQIILRLDNYYQKVIRQTEYYKNIKTILKNIDPDKLFCSHQRGVQCATIFAAANDLGIKNSTVIYSWDNLPKARLALRANNYYVWSEYMKNEMKIYYPEINQKYVRVTGTPQFEFYQNKENILSKEIFYKKYQLDLNKKIICFSGDDSRTSPDDHKYLNDLVEELISNKLDNEYQILLRRCPVDISGRFNSVVKKFPNIVKEAAPIWNYKNSNSWSTIYPSKEDINLLISTAYYSEVVINVGSTMAFDFAMFKKPCIFINYDQKDKANSKWSVDTIYQFQHFRSMPGKHAVNWWSKKEEISEILKNLSFESNANDMLNWMNIVIGCDFKFICDEL